MNIAYFRKSEFATSETVTRLKTAAEDQGFKVIGESALPGGNAVVVTVCRGDWAGSRIRTRQDPHPG